MVIQRKKIRKRENIPGQDPQITQEAFEHATGGFALQQYGPGPASQVETAWEKLDQQPQMFEFPEILLL